MIFYFFVDLMEYGGLDGLFIYLKFEISIFGLNFLDLDNENYFYYLCLLLLFNCYVFCKVSLYFWFGCVIDVIKENFECVIVFGYNIFYFCLVLYVLFLLFVVYVGYLFLF